MLLTIAEARGHITSELADEDFQLLLDAAESEITDALGPVGNIAEVLSTSGDLLLLSRRASAVVSVTERVGQDIDLDATDYELSGSGRILRRLSTGLSPAHWWRGRVRVLYTPVSDVARRKKAQIGLIQLGIDVTASGSAQSERIGDWSETFSSTEETRARRDDILASLMAGLVIA